jgi:flagellar hook-associated protein 1
VSLNDILGSALSGLAAAQAGLRSASNNIANVSTPGYARERVNLSTGVTAGQVNGVRVSEPERIADRFLEANVFRRQSDFGRGEVVYSYLDRLQALLGTPGDEAGLPARLNAIGAAAVAMTGSAATEQTVRSFTSNVQDALVSMQQIERDTTVLRTDAEAEVSYTVDKINDLLRRIADLNDAVSRQASLGRATGGVTDLRMTAVEELSSLLKVTVREQPDGRLFIETAGGVALVDKRLRTLSYPPSTGADQPIYPPIELRFVEEDGSIGAATGERLEGPTIGGKLGGLLELRDRLLPEFGEQMSTLFTGLAETLNAVSNAGTTVPAPRTLDGRQTGLAGSDRLGFTGLATFAVTSGSGSLVARTTIDFDALGPTATIDDAVAAINAGLGGAATASFTGGRLTITAAASANGVVVAQDATTPSSRAGIGFSHFFGLNDVITGPRGTLAPMGFVAADPHGFGTGETAEFALRDPAGRTLARQTLTVAAGGSFGDIVTALNAGPLSGFGSFALDDRGRLAFTPDPAIPTASVSITSDSTNRFGTGRSLTTLLQVPGASSALAASEVRPDILASARRLPLARLNAAAGIGQIAVGAGDNRGATAFVDELAKAVDLGRGQVVSIERYATLVLGRAGMDAAQAQDSLNDATARRDDAVNRRDNFSGVNIDEELSQLVILQNSYSASARVMTTASQMYDTLIAMVG